jgi:hypothetical protein
MPARGRRPVYEFGSWEIDLTRRELRAHKVPIGGRAFEVIEALVYTGRRGGGYAHLSAREVALRSCHGHHSIGRDAPVRDRARSHQPHT